jgi:uncharacterized protein YggE
MLGLMIRSWIVLVQVVLAVVASGCAAPVAAENRPVATIAATGTGRVNVRPDVAVVQVGAEHRAPVLADATAEVARRMTAVLARVKALGVDERDITTVVYAIDPLQAPRRSEEDPARILGYRASNVVQVKVRRLDTVGAVVDGAVAAGANVLRGLSFTLDDAAAAEAQARAQAVRNAATKARQLADAAGVPLGELLSLTEGTGPRPVVERFARSTAAMAVAPGPVESGQLEVLVTVEAHYRIGQPAGARP